MIEVIGLGPGSKEYILPIAIKSIKSANIVIGATRNLENISEYCQHKLDLSIGFENIRQYLIENQQKNIAVVVSGDTGFYSMLDFVKRTVEHENIKVIPGISSLQYLYGKLCKGYEHATWISYHGRETELEPYLKKNMELGILTDQKHNSRYIASKIKAYGYTQVKIVIGERLSYEDEKISFLSVDECVDYVAKDLSVVIITYDK